jgi:hypothetical protein
MAIVIFHGAAVKEKLIVLMIRMGGRREIR